MITAATSPGLAKSLGKSGWVQNSDEEHEKQFASLVGWMGSCIRASSIITPSLHVADVGQILSASCGLSGQLRILAMIELKYENLAGRTMLGLDHPLDVTAFEDYMQSSDVKRTENNIFHQVIHR